ncbi:MAG: hypothetical protein ACLUVG_06915 [Phocaeicola vulgatus]
MASERLRFQTIFCLAVVSFSQHFLPINEANVATLAGGSGLGGEPYAMLSLNLLSHSRRTAACLVTWQLLVYAPLTFADNSM